MHPLTRPAFCTPYAPHVLALAHTYPSSACHCEPVRTLVWQSAPPQGNLANWRYFRQIRSTSRIRPKYYFLSCLTAGSTDCHVAPLLAMTCRSLPRVRACKDALPGKPVTAYVFAQGAACFLLPLRGCGLPRRSAPRNDIQKFAACLRLPGGTAGIPPESVLATADTCPSSACHCEPVRTLVRQSVFPAGKLGKLAPL